MNTIIIGNIVAFIAASISLIIGIIKSKKKVLYVQTIQYSIYSIANFILGGFSGAIANGISIIRNILCYKEKLTRPIILLIIIVSTILTLSFNNLGFIGILPLFNTIVYTIFINIKDEFKFKILILTQMILWFIYDLTIRSYTSAAFDFITAIASAITAYQIYKNSKIKQQRN